MAIVHPDQRITDAMNGPQGDVVITPAGSATPLPDNTPGSYDVEEGRIRVVAVTQLFFLNMPIPFSDPGLASEQRTATADQQNFPLYLRAAWTNMAAPDVLLQIQVSSTERYWSVRPELIGTYAGRSNLVHPQLYYRRGYFLPSQTAIQGLFTNSPTAPEDNTSRIVWMCERPEQQAKVAVSRSMDFRLGVALQLSGGAGARDTAESQQIAEPLLIYGATTNADPLTEIKITDNQKNISWSKNPLPIGAFAGIDDGSNVQNIVKYPKPYLLAPNSSLEVEWVNNGADTGKYITFLAEKIMSQTGAPPINVPQQPPAPGPLPPGQQPPARQNTVRREWLFTGHPTRDMEIVREMTQFPNSFNTRIQREGWIYVASARGVRGRQGNWYRDIST